MPLEKRRELLIGSGALLAGIGTGALAQAPKHARVGFLSAAPPDLDQWSPLLLRSFAELGWVERRNLTFHSRFAHGRYERLSELASELVALKVQTILAVLNVAADAARGATRSIPIVILYALDPVGVGYAQSVARPGGNVTGVLYSDPGFTARFIQLKKETVPGMRRLALMYPVPYPGIEPYVEAADAAARVLGIATHRFPVKQLEDVGAALAAAKREGVDALRITNAGVLLLAEDQIKEFAAASNLPDFHAAPSAVEKGGFMSYSPRLSDAAARGAALVDRILKGAKPSELPFEYPTRMELVVNLKVAKQRGIVVPQSVLLRADRVIE